MRNRAFLLSSSCHHGHLHACRNGRRACAKDQNPHIYRRFVADSISGEPLSHINIYAPGIKKGAVTDKNGLFRISVPKGTSLRATSLGYEDKSIVIGDNVADTLRFMLSPASYDLTEFVVKPKKQKYSKKNNPAVDLMSNSGPPKTCTIPQRNHFTVTTVTKKCFLA